MLTDYGDDENIGGVRGQVHAITPLSPRTMTLTGPCPFPFPFSVIGWWFDVYDIVRFLASGVGRPWKVRRSGGGLAAG